VTPPDDADVEFHAPGDEDMRLVNTMKVATGKSVRLDGDEQNDEIVCIEFVTRSLASADETERRIVGMHYDAAQWLRDELDRVLHEAGRG
jgi:hypothetical protein